VRSILDQAHTIDDPPAQMLGLADKYPDRAHALVNVVVKYRAGRDNLNDLLAELDEIFPRCYARDWEEVGGPTANGNGQVSSGGGAGQTFRATVIDYVTAQLEGQPDRDEVLTLVDELLSAEE
jgi:hypothetical protein